jgi:hypothetical protein
LCIGLQVQHLADDQRQHPPVEKQPHAAEHAARTHIAQAGQQLQRMGLQFCLR